MSFEVQKTRFLGDGDAAFARLLHLWLKRFSHTLCFLCLPPVAALFLVSIHPSLAQPASSRSFSFFLHQQISSSHPTVITVMAVMCCGTTDML
jgi:hypothetical protein